MNKKILTVLIAIFLINFSLSLYIQIKDSQSLPICGINIASSCNQVTESSYSTVLGIKNTTIGIVVFPLLAIFMLVYYKIRKKYLKSIGSLILACSAIFALRLIYIQFFVLREICKFCIIIDTLTILSFLIFYYSKDR